jgi:hypothetical protein
MDMGVSAAKVIEAVAMEAVVQVAGLAADFNRDRHF